MIHALIFVEVDSCYLLTDAIVSLFRQGVCTHVGHKHAQQVKFSKSLVANLIAACGFWSQASSWTRYVRFWSWSGV